jgi:hypothetical protein
MIRFSERGNQDLLANSINRLTNVASSIAIVANRFSVLTSTVYGSKSCK